MEAGEARRKGRPRRAQGRGHAQCRVPGDRPHPAQTLAEREAAARGKQVRPTGPLAAGEGVSGPSSQVDGGGKQFRVLRSFAFGCVVGRGPCREAHKARQLQLSGSGGGSGHSCRPSEVVAACESPRCGGQRFSDQGQEICEVIVSLSKSGH